MYYTMKNFIVGTGLTLFPKEIILDEEKNHFCFVDVKSGTNCIGESIEIC